LGLIALVSPQKAGEPNFWQAAQATESQQSRFWLVNATVNIRPLFEHCESSEVII